jgi:hypothetical protein
MLTELAQIALSPRRLSTGEWAAGLGSGWRVVSSGDTAFTTLDQGRTALIQWARLHAGAITAISPRRCIVLADDGSAAWRLWQMVHAETSLRDIVDHALQAVTRDALLSGLRRAAQLLLDADARLGRMPLRLPCTPDCIGPSETGAIYIGLMPGALEAVIEPRPRRDPRSLLRCALEPVIASELRNRGLDFNDVIGRLQHPEGIAHAVTTLLGA